MSWTDVAASSADPRVSSAVALIQARGLVKHFREARAVRALSFEVKRGEVVGFLGPNGAGKSTTMKMLTGFLRPTRGAASIAGYDVATHALEAKRHLGYLPENAPFYDEMMVLDFLHFVADVRGVTGPLRRRRLATIVERCGLGGVLGKDIGELSKGYRQRVGLAQALVHDPDLLILDEPTSGLDPNQIVEIRALIRDLGRDKTVLLSTHILSEVQAVCSRALIIAGGKLVADDTPEALGARGAQAQVVVGFGARGEAPLNDAEVLAKLRELPGVTSVAPQQGNGSAELTYAVRGNADVDVRPALFELAVAQNWCVLELHRKKASLEETFARLTGAQASAGKDRHAA